MIGSRRRRGAVAALSAVIMVVVVGFAGLAVDLTRIWLLSARLKTAVDAASLVAARQMTSDTRDADTRRLFWANYTMNGRSIDYLRATVDEENMPRIATVGTTQVRVTAQATIQTTLFSIISRQNTLLEETSVAEREGTGLELAIVIDQTSSMRTVVNGQTKLEAAQDAARTMLGILYGNEDTKRNMWVSVVPFARTINIGRANSLMLDTVGMPSGWDVNNWSGCVEARRNGADLTDVGPNTAETRFRPYFWPSTFRQVGWVSNDTGLGSSAVGYNACSSTNAYPAVTVNIPGVGNRSVRYCRGDNDWSNANLSTNSGNDNWNPMYDYLMTYGGFTGVGYSATSAAGPNMLCAMTPITPLTASRAAVQAAVDAIEAPTRSGGTTVPVGMQGAWYTLSPNWQGQWTGIATSDEHGALPLAYGTRNMNKAVVILTDGDSNWQAPYGCSSTSCTQSGTAYTVRASASPSGTSYWFRELMYSAYGRRTDYNTNTRNVIRDSNNVPIGTTDATDIAAANSSSQQQANADAQLEDRFRQICTAMKNEGIRIYVIGFEVTEGSSLDDLLAECATSAATYVRAPTPEDLQRAFTEVANQLTSLRLVE
ncbi:hypothetical protein GXW74_18470 [Roseomonas eburnea]|uniref:Putative Flp pilus-assembly TadG-like N-terminal domain-containing protein n=1 Tax=Neoroseomonas eburnea TaxID=1346889 RepID=A0A9X9XFJ7_9PROT|nr:pilus assembly protein TadG-related protein [Neoroseomonas eburnea]MBR0682483.1 hypothetical protein [Neoroseomonas eburnea]